MRIGRKIAKLRENMGLTREELAEKCNIQMRRITEWELEEYNPSIRDLIKLSEVFNLTIDEIIKFDVGEESEEKIIIKEDPYNTKVFDVYIDSLFTSAMESVFSDIYKTYNLIGKRSNLYLLDTVCNIVYSKYVNEENQIYSKYLVKNTTKRERERHISYVIYTGNESMNGYIEGECEIDEAFRLLKDEIKQMQKKVDVEQTIKGKSPIRKNLAKLMVDCKMMSRMEDFSEEKLAELREEVCAIVLQLKKEEVLGELLGFLGERMIDALDRKDVTKLTKICDELKEISDYVIYRIPVDEELNLQEEAKKKVI